MFFLLLDAAANAPKVLNLQSLQTIGTAAGGGAVLTPVFNAMGQAIKQHPKVKNDWLRWILPLLAIILGTGILVGEVKLGYQVDPLTAFLFISMFLVGSVAADAAYNVLKQTPVLPPGPNNHPADASSSQTITITTPTTTGVTSILPSNASFSDKPPDTPIPTQNPVQGTTESPSPIPPPTPSPAPSSLPPSPFHP